MTVTFPSELEQEVKAKAARRGLDVAAYLFSLVNQDTAGAIASGPNNSNVPDGDHDPDALKKAVARITNRTPEEREAARQEILKTLPPPMPLPAGMTAQDVWNNLTGKDQDDEKDPDALRRAIAKITNRTPEQKLAAQERAIREYKPKRELPPGVSPLEVMPVIRGAETDEQVIAALKELS